MPNTAAALQQDDARHAAKTLVEFAYHGIREKILNGDLEPGSKLKVEVLRAEYGVAASTMREALSLLIADALVTAEGQRGFRVAPISLEDLQDITKMRKLLESQAVRESIENGSDEWEGEVVAAYHRLVRVEERIYDDPAGVIEEWEVRNRAFHDALLSGCKSKWLHHFHRILYDQAVRYRRMTLLAPQITRDVRKEHKDILDAVLARDVARATALVESHIDRTLDNLSTILVAKTQLKPAPQARRERAAKGTKTKAGS